MLSVLYVVSKVPQGLLVVVTDSWINVQLYSKGKFIAGSSTNSDLWVQLFQELDSKPQLRFKFEWVPSHTDEPVKYRKYQYSVIDPLYVAANLLAADHTIEQHVPSVQLLPGVTSVVLYYAKLTKQIQSRLIEVIIACCEANN